MKSLLLILSAIVLCLSAAGCASISQDDCQVGAWGDYGYKDGLNGRSSDRIAKYAKKCAEFGVKPNSAEYLTGYDQGVFKYCTYQQGYELGENGSDYNQVCSGPLAADFAPGYDEGRAVYEIYEEHKSLISGADDTHAALIEVRRKLKEDELAEGDRRRLEKKRRRLKEDRDDARIDVRAFERIHGLPRHRFD
jgi:hypothetical protein